MPSSHEPEMLRTEHKFSGEMPPDSLTEVNAKHEEIQALKREFESRIGALLQFGELRKANVERHETLWGNCAEWDVPRWAMAVTGEWGEACNFLKKIERGENVPMINVARELADVVIYLDLLALRLGINLGEAVVEKFNLKSAELGSDVYLKRLSPSEAIEKAKSLFEKGLKEAISDQAT